MTTYNMGEYYARVSDYDLEYQSQSEQDVPFWCELVMRYTPQRLLELACGSGRIGLTSSSPTSITSVTPSTVPRTSTSKTKSPLQTTNLPCCSTPRASTTSLNRCSTSPGRTRNTSKPAKTNAT